MRASIKWLKDYVDFNETPETLAEILTNAGVPVEGIVRQGQNIENVVTGKILSIEVHPNADRLTVCKLLVGDETIIIVTGATNIKAGDIVPVAKSGAILPEKHIGETDFRGVKSQGMLCSAEELGFDVKVIAPDMREGIFILPQDTPIGKDIKEVLGLDDVILEFELTANRADCFSMIGLAREIAVLTGGKLKKTMLKVKEEVKIKAPTLAKVDINEPELCTRFAVRILQDIKVTNSPLWMQRRLQSAGMRPINNIVDVTNFVMLELGQPMHAYDYNLLGKHTIIVRRAKEGEKLTTLDGVKRDLNENMLVIADVMQPVGIAGVMGGLATEVTANTQNVLLEAASFYGPSVRRTARALGLRSEASGRFERGVDTANIAKALDRAAELLEAMGACKTTEGIIDSYPSVSLPSQITFTSQAINEKLGADVPENTVIKILKSLEFDVEQNNNNISVTVPTWRNDVTGVHDICEEIGRVYGFNNITSRVPEGVMKQGQVRAVDTFIRNIKEAMVGFGFTETISFSFSHPETIKKLRLQESYSKAVPVLNPITEDFPILRTNLTGNVLETVARNLSRKNEDLRIFEIGNIFTPRDLLLNELPEEKIMFTAALVGKKHEINWSQSREGLDFYDATGMVEAILAYFSIKDYEVSALNHPSLHPGKTACFKIKDQMIAVVGELHPSVCEAFGINKKVYIIEIPVEILFEQVTKLTRYTQLPKYPSINRDMAIIVDKDICACKVKKIISEAGTNLLTNVSLFDVYEGEQVPQEQKSLAFSLTFTNMERTLTDNEVEEVYNKILSKLSESINGVLRN